jgi:dipeptide/tripeptide permease
MVGAMGLLSVMAGAVGGYLSERFPGYVEALETGAGVLLIGGFALAGCALPVIL